MSIGYACLAVAVPGGELKNCMLKNATEERLLSLVGQNLDSLETLIDYNIQNSIDLFRISSNLIPFGSSIAAELPWRDLYAEKLSTIGNKIKRSGMRVSMHPGQYTVLNSPDHGVAERAVQDLEYHSKVLDCMGLGPNHKIILHLGGAYNDKGQAKDRFVKRYQQLGDGVRGRLVIENDDISFNIIDVLETASACEIPVVFDNLHHHINPAPINKTEIEWIRQCGATWKKHDGLQKIHYSQQHTGKKPGAHSESIDIDKFLDFYGQLAGMNLDIMLEVKDKNMSALKCINCSSNQGIGVLETEWARYKYAVLERSPDTYGDIRKILADKSTYPALDMYRLIETAFGMPVVAGNAVNAARHVWGYVKNKSSVNEKKRFERLLEKFTSGEGNLQSVKNNLLLLARRYDEDYLLRGYYLYT